MKKSAAFLILSVICFASLYGADNTEIVNTVKEELGKMYSSNLELSIGASTSNVGSFTWEDSNTGTFFSSFLRKAVEEAVSASPDFDLVLTDLEPVFGPEAAEVLQKNREMNTGTLLIYGMYTISGPAVNVDLKIYSNVFSKMMAESTISIPIEQIPRGMQIIPADSGRLGNLQKEIDNLYGESPLDIYITTARGPGAVFTEGEYMKVYLLASEDCYVKMFLIGADNHTTQIFPNRFESNNFLPGKQVLEFPGKNSPFKFQLVPPLGTEAIKVIASTRKFTDSGEDFKDLGIASRGILIVETDTGEQETMAEGQVFYTILPK